MSLSTQINRVPPPIPPPFFTHFQLISSLLAQHSDLNHLIGVSIWVSNWPGVYQPDFIMDDFILYRQHYAASTNKLVPTPIPYTPSTSRHVDVLSFLSYFSSFSCHSCCCCCYYFFLFMHVPLSLLLFFSSPWPHTSLSCRGMLKLVEVSNEGGPLGIHVVPFSSQDIR